MPVRRGGVRLPVAGSGWSPSSLDGCGNAWPPNRAFFSAPWNPSVGGQTVGRIERRAVARTTHNAACLIEGTGSPTACSWPGYTE